MRRRCANEWAKGRACAASLSPAFASLESMTLLLENSPLHRPTTQPLHTREGYTPVDPLHPSSQPLCESVTGPATGPGCLLPACLP